MGRARDNANAALAVADLKGSFPRAVAGLTIARETATSFSVSAGMAANENGTPSTALLKMSVPMTKTLGSFAVGTGNGALDTGAVAVSTWYHVHLIRRDSDGVTDVLLSASATAPTMPIGWSNARRIGSILTNGSLQITPFLQVGNVFTWEDPVTDVNSTNPGTAAVSTALTVPAGVRTFPIVTWIIKNVTSSGVELLVSSLDGADYAPTANRVTVASAAAGASARSSSVVSTVPSNLNSRVRSRLSTSGASDSVIATTMGWIDPRGA